MLLYFINKLYFISKYNIVGKDCPVDFNRVLQHVRAKCPYRDEQALDADQIKKATESFLKSDSLNDCSADFKTELR